MSIKNCLLCVSGMSPAIITETYYWLAKQRQEQIVADEVVVITTAIGKQKIMDELLLAPNNRFAQMAERNGWPQDALTEANILVVQNKAGQYLDDIREPEEFSAFADLVLKTIAEKTSNKNLRVHASLAGGRKTMSYYLGLAMNIFGRADDTLSHVLLDSAYEQAINFYYPGQKETLLNRAGEPLDLPLDGDHIVEMSEFPIINLSKSVNIERLRNKHLSFDEVLKIIKDEQNGVVEAITWQKEQRKLFVNFGQERLALAPTELAMLIWLAWRAKNKNSPVDMTKDPDEPDKPALMMKQAYLEYLLTIDYVKEQRFTLYNNSDDFIAEHKGLLTELDYAPAIVNKVQPIHSRLIAKMQAVSSAYLKDGSFQELPSGFYAVNAHCLSEQEFNNVQSWMKKYQKVIEPLLH